MANSATFRIRSVRCRDETGGSFRENFGNDEIKCAVFSADLRGSTRNSGRIDIYDNFDDGDVKTFNPPREVVTLDLAGAAGEVELSFSVLLIESQLFEGDGLQKEFESFVKLYEESLKGQLSKLQLSLEQAHAIAQPGYLAPPTRVTRVPSIPGTTVLEPVGATVGVSATGSAAASGTGNAPASVTGTLASVHGDDDPSKKLGEKVGDAFIIALATACALLVVRSVGVVVNEAQDKLFLPVAIKAKVDASTPPENVPPNGTGVAEFRGHDGIYEIEWDILVC